MTFSGAHGDDPRDAVLEIRRLQVLARAAGISFAFPLLLFGVAGVISGLLLTAVRAEVMSIWVYNSWWAVVALTAPVLVARHYQHRLVVRGVGIGRSRAGRYTAATELVAAVLWFAHPLYPVQVSAPWLAFAAGAVVVGRVWHDRTLAAVAAVVCAVVAGGAVWQWPMPVTDLLVGVIACAAAIRAPHRGGPLRTMLPPA